MNGWVWSLVMAFADADKADAEKLSVAMGYSNPGDSCYTVPLSATGALPATHWMCHSFANSVFAEMIFGIGEGTLPPPEAGGTWEDYGLTEARVWELMGGVILSLGEGADPVEHVNAVLAGAGLQKCS